MVWILLTYIFKSTKINMDQLKHSYTTQYRKLAESCLGLSPHILSPPSQVGQTALTHRQMHTHTSPGQSLEPPSISSRRKWGSSVPTPRDWAASQSYLLSSDLAVVPHIMKFPKGLQMSRLIDLHLMPSLEIRFLPWSWCLKSAYVLMSVPTAAPVPFQMSTKRPESCSTLLLNYSSPAQKKRSKFSPSGQVNLEIYYSVYTWALKCQAYNIDFQQYKTHPQLLNLKMGFIFSTLYCLNIFSYWRKPFKGCK